MNSTPSEPIRFYRHVRNTFGQFKRKKRPSQDQVATPSSMPFSPGRDPEKLTDTIAGFTESMGWGALLAEQELVLNWAKLVGQEVAEHTEVDGLREGTLTVRCDSTAWAAQLGALKNQFLATLAEEMPEVQLESIRFVGPSAPSWKHGIRSVPGRGPRDTYG